ncbi:MAG: hypothetical protein ACHQIM_16305 [Sphingobacteriales bacterium]
MIKTVIHHKITAYSKKVRLMGKDQRLMATHISLFTALFVQWQRNDFASPFPVTRKELMGYSRIASVATYHKCIRELDEFGYIRYQPSFNPKKGSLVYWPDEV